MDVNTKLKNRTEMVEKLIEKMNPTVQEYIDERVIDIASFSASMQDKDEETEQQFRACLSELSVLYALRDYLSNPKAFMEVKYKGLDDYFVYMVSDETLEILLSDALYPVDKVMDSCIDYETGRLFAMSAAIGDHTFADGFLSVYETLYYRNTFVKESE